MSSGRDRLQAVLDGNANFLLEKDLAPPKHQPYPVHCVRDFLFEQTLVAGESVITSAAE